MKSIEVSNLKYLKTSCKLVVRTSPGTDRSRVRRNRLLKTAGACRGCRALLATGGETSGHERRAVRSARWKDLSRLAPAPQTDPAPWQLVLWALVADVWVLFLLLVVVPWMIRQGHQVPAIRTE